MAGVALVSENAPLDMKQFVFLFGNDDFSVLTTASNPDPDVPFIPPRPPKKFAMSADNKSHRLYVKGKHISYQRGKVCAHRIRVLWLPF